MRQSAIATMPLLDPARTEAPSAAGDAPLCVDLDGTLLRSNSLLEVLLALVSRRPQAILLIPFWLLRGQAYTWNQVMKHVNLNVALLPYAPAVVSFIQNQPAGRRIILITGAHHTLARRVALFIGGFDAVFGSRGKLHLVGKRKRDLLRRKFGDQGFDYIGDSTKDLPVWKVARRSYLAAGTGSRLASTMTAAGVEHSVIDTNPVRKWKAFLKALRPHQWTKNFLVIVPLFLNHRASDLSVAWRSFAAFGLYCLAASAMYLINDLVDLESDRAHETKKRRPFASASLGIGTGIATAIAFIGLALGLGLWMSPTLALAILLYMLVTICYSMWLKKLLIIDVVVLALLYAFRMIAGAAAISIRLSFWTLAFSLFFFFSLALMKRYAELRNLVAQGKKSNARRGYALEDLPQISILGVGSGLIAVLVVGLYINGVEVRQLYHRPDLLWLICPTLLAWISRLWILTNRGDMDEDPVAYAFRDPWSVGAGVIIGLIGLAAL